MVSARMTDVASDVQAGLADLAEPLVLKRGTTSYPFAGWSAVIDMTRISGSGVTAGDIMVTALANTLAVTPKAGDTITIDGKARAVVAVARDPAGACWQIQVRG